MAWLKKGIWSISKSETLIPFGFKSRLIFKVTNISGLKDTWFYAGYFYQYLKVEPLDLVRIDHKINMPIREPIFFTPQKFENSYQLKFNLADWIKSLTLTIYENSMPLNFEPIVNVPSTVASSAVSSTVPISATSVSFLAVNANRKKLMIANNCNQDLYLDLDATASIADHAIKIPKITPGGFIATYELDQYTGVVSGIWAANGTGAALVREMV
jgi:hypothetical protein